MSSGPLLSAIAQALDVAEPFCGATAPNPPVGASALDEGGGVLGSHAHERSGRAHAEAGLLEQLEAQGRLRELDTLVVTLEPCNHHGRTPPCTDAILRSGVRRLVYLASDPNPQAAGGAERLRASGIEVVGPAEAGKWLDDSRRRQLRLQLGPFLKRVSTGLPWITVKRAFDAKGSMIPPAGQKTFTSESSLKLAHELRRRSDAILTGSGTVLADQPEFTVRRVSDHPGKIRALWIADRRARVGQAYLAAALSRGLMAEPVTDWRRALEQGAALGALEVLVEAGPELSSAVLQGDLWDRCVDIHAEEDRIVDSLR